MRIILKSLLSILFLVFVIFNLYTAESDIKKALELKPKNIIRCGQTANQDDILPPAQALAKLAKGDMLIIEPGSYGEIVVNKDSVIISTEGKIPVNLSIVLMGKNCVLKDFVGNLVRCGQDFSIVNSAVDSLYLEGDEKKAELTIYNSAIGNIYNNGYDKEWNIFIKNCVIRARSLSMIQPQLLEVRNSTAGAIYFSQRCIFEIQNSVLCGSPYVFLFSIYGRSIKAKLTLKDNVLFGENGIGMVSSYSNDKNNNLVILELKDIKKIINVNLQGENKVQKIEFAGDRFKDPAYYTVKNPELKGIGVITEENKFFSQPPLERQLQELNIRHMIQPPMRPTENRRVEENRIEKEEDVFE